jgi:uncharacterized protein
MPADMTDADFIAAVLSNRINRTILERLPALDLPDAWLVSGALFQTVWNVLTKRAPEYGVRDYDIFYFNPDDSWAAEDAVIRRVREVFADVPAEVEIRNQARVHLWYAQKFGMPYPPLVRATDGIDRFLMHNAQVGIRAQDGAYEIYAPHGFDDLAGMIVRPNRTENFRADLYYAKAERWKALWPEIRILPA